MAVEKAIHELIERIEEVRQNADHWYSKSLERCIDAVVIAVREEEAAKIVHCGDCFAAKPYADEPDMVECKYGCDRSIHEFCSLGYSAPKEKP